MNQWFEHLTAQMSLASDEIDASKMLEGLTAEAGFGGYAYINLHANTYKLMSNYAPPWQDLYIEKRFHMIDPILALARERIGAFSWAAPTGRVTRAQRRFFAEAAEFGIRAGISIPIRAGFGHAAMLTLVSDDPGFAQSRKIDPVVAASAVAQMHTRIDVMNLASKLKLPVRLKPGELTCLKWCAEGKALRAIAVIENISYATVCFHLRNARKALNAGSLAQATAIATELGLI